LRLSLICIGTAWWPHQYVMVDFCIVSVPIVTVSSQSYIQQESYHPSGKKKSLVQWLTQYLFSVCRNATLSNTAPSTCQPCFHTTTTRNRPSVQPVNPVPSLRDLSQSALLESCPKGPHEDAYQRETIQMQFLWQVFQHKTTHAASLLISSWRSTRTIRINNYALIEDQLGL